MPGWPKRKSWFEGTGISINAGSSHTDFHLKLRWDTGSTTCANNATKGSNDTDVITTSGSGRCPLTVNGVGPGEAEIDGSDYQPSDDMGGFDTFMAQSPSTGVFCNLGITNELLVNTGAHTGKVTYKVTTGGCPEGTTALVSFTGVEFTDTLNWSAPSSKTAVIPSDGTDEEEREFTTTGSGAMQVRLNIQNCNSGDCSIQKITLGPNPVTTSQQNW